MAPCPTTCRARTGCVPNGKFQALPELGWRDQSQHRGADHRRADPAATSGTGLRTCLGILRLYRGIDVVRAEAISVRAVEIGALNYQSVASILEHRLETKTATRTAGQLLADPARQHPRFPLLLPLRRTTLLQHPTIDRSCLARPGGHDQEPARSWWPTPESNALDHMEWLGILLEHEMTLRQQKRFEARARTAKLRHLAAVEDIDYRAARGLGRTHS